MGFSQALTGNARPMMEGAEPPPGRDGAALASLPERAQSIQRHSTFATARFCGAAKVIEAP
jgi:hypothetical protein